MNAEGGSQVDSVDYVVYGKIIIDAVRRKDGVVEREMLGGGGPQGAFGARVWSPSVGLMTRTGFQFEEKPARALHALNVDLQGWNVFPDIKTPHGGMEYDENEYMRPRTNIAADLQLLSADIRTLLAQEIEIPPAYQRPRVIHLITEWYHDKIYRDAHALKAHGVTFSVEPLIDYRGWTNTEQTLAALPDWDLMSPDWPSASGIAGSTDPAQVLGFWAERARERGPHVIAIRHGAQGSFVWERATGKTWHVPPAPVAAVIDPTGAGNAYAGGLMVGWDQTQNGLEAACRGAVSASFLVETVGVPAWSPAVEAEAERRLARLRGMVSPL